MITAAAPTFAPAAGKYTSAQSVTISDAVGGATIFYTTDGTVPTKASTVYAGPITVSANETIKALAIPSNYAASVVASAVYAIVAAAPTFAPAAGKYTSAQSVTISDAVSGATIYYTTDGTVPTTGSTVYAGPVTVSADQTLKAVAIAQNYTNSAVASAVYLIVAAAPTFVPAAGKYTSAQSVMISDAVNGATIYYTTDGTVPTKASTVYAGPITVSADQTIKAIAIPSNYAASAVASAAYVIVAAAPTFAPAAGKYTSAQSVAISDAVSGATIYYTTDGTVPTKASTVYAGPITVGADQTIKAIAIPSNYAASAVASAAYVIVTPTPTYAPAAGKYTGAQSVTISDTVSGATIYYTTDGTVPTTGSTVYGSPITVSANQTIKAIAIAQNYAASVVAASTYKIVE